MESEKCLWPGCHGGVLQGREDLKAGRGDLDLTFIEKVNMKGTRLDRASYTKTKYLKTENSKLKIHSMDVNLNVQRLRTRQRQEQTINAQGLMRGVTTGGKTAEKQTIITQTTEGEAKLNTTQKEHDSIKIKQKWN